jgi:hypothetical protein
MHSWLLAVLRVTRCYASLPCGRPTDKTARAARRAGVLAIPSPSYALSSRPTPWVLSPCEPVQPESRQTYRHSVTDAPIPERLALVAAAGLERIGPVRHEFTPDEIGDLHDRGLAWHVLFELGTSSAPFTHAVRLVAPHDLRDRCAIVQL